MPALVSEPPVPPLAPPLAITPENSVLVPKEPTVSRLEPRLIVPAPSIDPAVVPVEVSPEISMLAPAALTNRAVPPELVAENLRAPLFAIVAPPAVLDPAKVSEPAVVKNGAGPLPTIPAPVTVRPSPVPIEKLKADGPAKLSELRLVVDDSETVVCDEVTKEAVPVGTAPDDQFDPALKSPDSAFANHVAFCAKEGRDAPNSAGRMRTHPRIASDADPVARDLRDADLR